MASCQEISYIPQLVHEYSQIRGGKGKAVRGHEYGILLEITCHSARLSALRIIRASQISTPLPSLSASRNSSSPVIWLGSGQRSGRLLPRLTSAAIALEISHQILLSSAGSGSGSAGCIVCSRTQWPAACARLASAAAASFVQTPSAGWRLHSD